MPSSRRNRETRVMGEFKHIQMFLLWILVLRFAASETGLSTPMYNVRLGDNVTMACENVIKGHHKCNSTTWAFSRGRDPKVELVKLGKINAESNRLSVTEGCFLRIRKVREEDVGRYYCQQYVSGKKQGLDAEVHLAVVTMTEEKKGDEVTLRCSVWTHGRCKHGVRWLFELDDVKKQNQGARTFESPCNGNVTFDIYSFMYKSRHDLLDCEVTYGNRGQLIPFRLQPSDQNTSGGSTTSITESSTPTEKTETTGKDINSAAEESSKLTDWLWLFVTVPLVVLLLLTVTVVIVIKRRRTKGQRRQRNDGVSYQLPSLCDPAEHRSLH
ncbi:uncharacterized protein LOC127367995 isoform X5 [Xyrichtys novacula]|uniref:Uncharacterized protein LOC127367995 isoform X5 n=1 Tax=Xyrichtys novacula TaxID=13765 RepID=A0AAV1H0V5_XYRNO|nr:uncharacterized protein LOC127367995 isoform X5 [Xyrichtys novacula]